jgi:hypothetical protein
MQTNKDSSNQNRGTARIIKENVRAGAIPVLVGVTDGESAFSNQPRARLVHDEDGATRIEVTCHCGKKIVIECEYT